MLVSRQICIGQCSRASQCLLVARGAAFFACQIQASGGIVWLHVGFQALVMAATVVCLPDHVYMPFHTLYHRVGPISCRQYRCIPRNPLVYVMDHRPRPACVDHNIQMLLLYPSSHVMLLQHVTLRLLENFHLYFQVNRRWCRSSLARRSLRIDGVEVTSIPMNTRMLWCRKASCAPCATWHVPCPCTWQLHTSPSPMSMHMAMHDMAYPMSMHMAAPHCQA